MLCVQKRLRCVPKYFPLSATVVPAQLSRLWCCLVTAPTDKHGSSFLIERFPFTCEFQSLKHGLHIGPCLMEVDDWADRSLSHFKTGGHGEGVPGAANHKVSHLSMPREQLWLYHSWGLGAHREGARRSWVGLGSGGIPVVSVMLPRAPTPEESIFPRCPKLQLRGHTSFFYNPHRRC